MPTPPDERFLARLLWLTLAGALLIAFWRLLIALDVACRSGSATRAPLTRSRGRWSRAGPLRGRAGDDRGVRAARRGGVHHDARGGSGPLDAQHLLGTARHGLGLHMGRSRPRSDQLSRCGGCEGTLWRVRGKRRCGSPTGGTIRPRWSVPVPRTILQWQPNIGDPSTDCSGDHAVMAKQVRPWLAKPTTAAAPRVRESE
jgi:hypothetical protein